MQSIVTLLLISLIARIITFGGCPHHLEVIQLIYHANWLTSFSVMGISIEKHFRAICKIIFFVIRILLLLSILSLALIYFACMIYLVFFTLHCFSTLVCANLVHKSFGRFCYYDLRSTFTDVAPYGYF